MKKFVKWSLISFGILVLLAVATFFCVFVYFSQTSHFDKSKLDVASFNITLYDDKENLIKEDNLVNHKSIKLSSLPPHVYQCFVATEDKNFYNHKGLDYKRMVKATLVNLKSFKFKQGASTISQQLIKNTHLTNEKTLTRKFREIAITRKMEKELSKNEILESYLNCIYFGNNCYGIESAANFYFSKSAKNLTPSESALLAGIISAPSKYNPITRAENCKKKRDIVLTNLCDFGSITPSTLQEEKEKPILLNITKSDESKINSYSQMAI
ncbi:MAG: transglycosylase domain-containing protein, partial [Christensenellales bacterium]